MVGLLMFWPFTAFMSNATEVTENVLSSSCGLLSSFVTLNDVRSSPSLSIVYLCRERQRRKISEMLQLRAVVTFLNVKSDQNHVKMKKHAKTTEKVGITI